eukprot:NP_001230187.1 uncharacterized protein LOC215467 [Mus musculus]
MWVSSKPCQQSTYPQASSLIRLQGHWEKAWNTETWLWRLKEAEEKGDPVGGPAVSINLDSRDLSNTGPPNRQHTPADMRPPRHIQQRIASFLLMNCACLWLF